MGRERERQQRVDSLGGFEEKSSRSLGGKEKKSLEESSEEGDNFWETFTGKEGVLEQRAFSILILRVRDREKNREFIVGFSGFGEEEEVN